MAELTTLHFTDIHEDYDKLAVVRDFANTHNIDAVLFTGDFLEMVSNELDDRGMVVDFSEISRVIKSWLDGTLDHTMLLRKDDPLIPLLRERNERFFVMDANPTAESIARLIYDYAVSQNFPVTKVTLWETSTSFATYSGAKRETEIIA